MTGHFTRPLLEGTSCPNFPKCGRPATGWLSYRGIRGLGYWTERSCEECATAAAKEYRTKLGEDWTYRPGERCVDPLTNNVVLRFPTST